MASREQKTLLIFSQTFVPDPAAVGQYMSDVAFEMGRRGYRVVVYTANAGYENPSVKYAAREVRHGVEVRRLAFSSFGKKSLLIRALGTFTFMVQCLFIALFTRNLGGIFFSTSPPLIGAAATLVKLLRGVPVAYWAMDLNPDQLIAMGKIGPQSFIARVLEWVNKFIVRNADLVVALDRFMAERLLKRGLDRSRMLVMPPWPLEEHLAPVEGGNNPFREKHGLTGKFVIMYSGNHSPANPLSTLLEAVVGLKDDAELRFVFVGGGLGKKEVEACISRHQLTNAISLPYQPLETLGQSLGAADVHVVSLGTNMVGIIHPCKIYGAMAVARPILFLGPRPSHVWDLLERHQLGWHVEQGDAQGCVNAIQALRRTSAEMMREMGAVGLRVLHAQMSQAMLCGRFCDALGQVLCRPTGKAKHSFDVQQSEEESSCENCSCSSSSAA